MRTIVIDTDLPFWAAFPRTQWCCLLLAALVFLGLPAPHVGLGQTTLIPQGAVWKYLDDGSNQGTNWTQIDFDDRGWASGPAELGYGDGDEATVLGYGPDANNKYVTTYFRNRVTVWDPWIYTNLLLRVLRDDGAVVYLNGTEVFRTNVPLGPVSYLTLASVVINARAEETNYVEASLDPALLRNGLNLVAVEVHQWESNTSDLSFNLELLANTQYVLIYVDGRAQRGVVTVTNSAEIRLSASYRGGLIVYSLDGSEPGLDSSIYSSPFRLSRSTIIRVKAFSPDFSEWAEAPPLQVIVLPTFSLAATTAGGGTISVHPAALVSWWPGDETGQDIISDNHGTVIGATYEQGPVGSAFGFDGINDRVNIADSESLKLTHSLTIEGWVHLKSIPSTDGMILFRG